MKASQIPHNRLTFGDEECQAVLQAVRSGQWAHGAKVHDLEVALARMGGAEHAVCVSSGLSALRLALGAVGIGSGDTVVVPAYSCVALANAVLAWGATPRPVDVDPVGWNIEPKPCKLAVRTSRARAVIAVNTFGMPAEIDEIASSGVPVIEDCAHAFGLKVGKKHLGSRAQAGVLSFYATKLIGGGEGGAVLTNSREIAGYVRSARDYSDQPASAYRLNDKMNDLEAALVLAQLGRLREMIAARKVIAGRYFQLLSNHAGTGAFRLPVRTTQRVWYRFVVEMLNVPAETVIAGLQRSGIHAACPVTDWRAPGSPDTPVADRAYQRLVSLPLYPTLTEREQDSVVKAFLELCQESERV